MKRSPYYHSRRRAFASFAVMGLLTLPLCGQAATVSLTNTDGIFLLQAQETTVKAVFDYVEQHSKYVFVYGPAVQKRLADRVTVSLKGSNMLSLVKELCSQTGLGYRVNGRQVSIVASSSSANIQPRPQQKAGKGRTKTITGNIVDASGEPLIGATVKVRGTTIATVTDIDGNYSIEVPEGATMEVSYVGFNNAEFKVGARQAYNVEMSEDNNTLDELVVIGYGTVKKKDLTGAVAAVKGDELVNRRTTMLSNALQGSLSGVQVTRNNSAPGAGASAIRVRGVTTIGESSPLVIVDGVESSLD